MAHNPLSLCLSALFRMYYFLSYTGLFNKVDMLLFTRSSFFPAYSSRHSKSSQIVFCLNVKRFFPLLVILDGTKIALRIFLCLVRSLDVMFMFS